LDEALPCDFRAAIVPFGQAVESLKTGHADWAYSKLVLSQYPMTWLRTLFPTLGRSRGLMGATMIKVKDMIKRTSKGPDTMVGPTIKFGKGADDDEYTKQKLSNWPHSQVVGKLVAMKVEFHGTHTFDGAKKLALERMLQYGNQKGRTIVVVMPISSAYTKEFISPELVQKFDAALADIQRSSPQTELVRLDQVPGLGADENFCDLVHMNVTGQQLATDALLAQMKLFARQP
jgi:hypothetical protein